MPRIEHRHRRAGRRIALAGLISLWLGAAWALPPALRDRLATLPAAVQHEMEARGARWEHLGPVEQRAVEQRLHAWDALPLAVRRDRREAWQAWQALPTDQRLRVRAAALAYAALPLDQQRALRAQFDQLDGSERRGWRLGPQLGAGFAVLQPLLLQVPADERAPLLAALRAMDAGERNDLGVLAQRTPPDRREALRHALLSTAAVNRARWLQQELAR